MKVFFNIEIFNYFWEEVLIVNWWKYCLWNDKFIYVFVVDIISWIVDFEIGILCIECFIICKQSMFEILKKILGVGMED